MSIQKLPSGKYRAVVRRAGEKRNGTARSTRREAVADEAQIRLEMAAPSSEEEVTVDALFRDQIEQGRYAATTGSSHAAVTGVIAHVLAAVLHSLISSDIEGGATMTDILIRDIPDAVIAAIDARAKRVGLSRSEYLRRTLERERVGGSGPVTVDHLERVASLAADLDDPDVMSGAWS